MQETYYSVEQISRLLGMHPKTIQRYIREGRLHASKIGKSWRVAGHELSRFAEAEQTDTPVPQQPRERARASAVVDCAVDGEDEAQRMTRQLGAALHSRPPELGSVTMTTQYIAAEGLVRLTLWGSPAFMAAIFSMLDLYLRALEDEKP